MPYFFGYIGIPTLHLLDHSWGNLFSSTYLFCICFGKEHWQLWPKLPSVLAEIVLRFKHSRENYCLDNSTGALHHKKIPFSQRFFRPRDLHSESQDFDFFLHFHLLLTMKSSNPGRYRRYFWNIYINRVPKPWPCPEFYRIK